MSCSNQSTSSTSSEQASDAPESSQVSAAEIEKREEDKLKKKYEMGGAGGGGGLGHSAFLQRRWLQKGKGPKYFDSGDYQMAKQKDGQSKSLFANKPTPGIIPTPESVPTKKMSVTAKPNMFPTSSS